MVTSAFPGAPTNEVVDGISVMRVNPGVRPMRMIRNYFAYRRYFAGRVDVVLEEAEGPQGPFLLKFFVKEPIVLLWYQLGRQIFLGQFGRVLGRLLSLLDYVYARLYRTNLIAVLSVSSAREISRVSPASKKVVLHPGLPDPGTPLSLPDRGAPRRVDGLYLLSINKLRRYKAFDHAIRAFGMVASEFPGLRLVIGGVREDLRYEEELATLGEQVAPDRVLILPDLTVDEKDALLSGAYAFVLPSPVEGFSVATLEALSYGTPAIVTDGVPEDLVVGGYNGLRFRFGDLPELAERYRYLLRNPELRERLSGGAKESAKKFSWDQSADRLLVSLEALLKDRRNPPRFATSISSGTS
jgi:glycosyltransferase involved in cell wall biosynthesis